METKISVVVNKINDWYASKNSLIFFLGTTSLIGLIQIILFLSGVININSFNIDDKSILPWIAVFISLLSCYLGFVGGILVFRGDGNFIYFQASQAFLSLITALMSGLLIDSMAVFYGFIFTFFRKIAWEKKWIEKWNLKPKTLTIIGISMFISLILIFSVIETLVLPEEAHYWPGTTELKAKWSWYFDGIAAASGFTGTTLFLFRWRWAFLAFFIGKFFVIASYAYAQMYVPIVQMLLFAIMDFTGFFAWSHHLVKKNNDE